MQVLLTPRYDELVVLAAPDPRDVIWPNVTREARGVRLRRLATTAALGVLLVVWSGFVSAILSLANLKELEVVFPALRRLDESTYFYALLTGYLPTVIQLGLFNLLPVLFELAARAYEGQKSSFEVQRSVLDRYFYFQLVNVFVTVSSGSVLEELCEIVKNGDVTKIAEVLSDTLPLVAAYLMQLIVVKTLFGLAWELARPTAIVYTWTRKLVPYRYRTRRRAAPAQPRALHGRVLPSFLLVLVIRQIYAVIAPCHAVRVLVLACAELAQAQPALLLRAKFESGGLLWPSLFEHTVTGLVVSWAVLHTTSRSSRAYPRSR